MADKEVKDTAGQAPQEPKTYTQDELSKLLQSEADKRVTEALKTAKDKWELEADERIKKARTEAEEMAKLSAQEKELALQKQRADELAKKEHELTVRELQLKAIDILAEKKLPVGFAKTLLGETAEITFENIKIFEAEFQKAVKEEVEAKLKGTTPKGGTAETFDMNAYLRRGR